jgi:predicted permease
MQNPLVWSTAIAVALSACGSAALLDPSSPLALKHLAFLEALLGWFAQTTPPLTLFTTGLWMYSNQQQQQRAHGRAGAPIVSSSSTAELRSGTVGDESSVAAMGLQGHTYGSRDVAWRDVLTYLGLRATLAPAFMVLVCWVMGFSGDLAHALVILALLPVAQTAFVVCKQAETGMAAVSLMLVASLFMMLPQLMLVLALLEGSGVLSPDT